MHNTVLKNDLKSLTKQKDDLEITNGEVGGCSIEIFYPKTQTDIGSYIYTDVKKRDSDLAELNIILK
jgi:hypothetical protein